MMSLRKLILCLGLALALLGREGAAAQSSNSPRRGPEAKDMALVGYHDLQARSAYQPVIERQGNRFIAYIGHHGGSAPNPFTGKTETNGTSIIDVTDPRKPQYLFHIPGEKGEGEAGGAQMARVCPGGGLPKSDPAKRRASSPIFPSEKLRLASKSNLASGRGV